MYKIISSENISDFVSQVNSETKKQWQPIGGLVIYQGIFYQALLYMPTFLLKKADKESIMVDLAFPEKTAEPRC